jgi:hypothetical protein
VGGLGGLAKLVFDQHKAQEAAANEKRKEREAAADELRDRRYRFISTLVEVIYNIETAKLVMRANRSVRSWTDMVNDRILPGCSRLADMTHQLNNWAEAGSPMFDDTEGVAKELQGMNDYFAALLAEYGNKKQTLGELQLKAEEAKQRATKLGNSFSPRSGTKCRNSSFSGVCSARTTTIRIRPTAAAMREPY